MSRLRPILPQAVVVLVLVLLAVALGVASGEAPLEITLRARGMAFYVDGNDAPNPVLELPRDRRVRLTFVNQDRGIDHDLELPQLDERTRVLPGDGSRQTIELRTPDAATTSSYDCSLHPTMMQGRVEIR